MRAVALIGRYLFCCEMLCRYVCTALYVCTVPVSYCALLLLLLLLLLFWEAIFFGLFPLLLVFFLSIRKKYSMSPPPYLSFPLVLSRNGGRLIGCLVCRRGKVKKFHGEGGGEDLELGAGGEGREGGGGGEVPRREDRRRVCV